jgi:hypothetical protein
MSAPPRSPGDDDDGLVRAFLTALDKLAKTLDLYVAGALVEPAARGATAAIQRVLAAIGTDLELRVSNQELFFGDVVVYANPDPTRSLASSLYRDGVRRVLFHPQITAIELVDLVRILRSDLSKGASEHTIVTLLWMRNFQGFSYKAIEDFFGDEEAFVDDDYDSYRIVDVVRRQGKAQMGGTTMSMSSKELENIVGGARPTTTGDLHKSQLFELTAQEMAQVKAEADEPADLKLRRFLDVVFDVLRTDKEQVDIDHRVLVLKQIHEQLLPTASTSTVLPLVRGLRSLSRSLSYGGELKKTALLEAAVASFATPAVAARVVDWIGAGAKTDDVLGYVSEIGTAAVMPLARVLTALPQGGVRSSVVGLIDRLCEGRLDPVVAAFDLPEPAPELVAMAARMVDERVPALLMTLAGGLDEPSAIAALQAMANEPRPEYERVLARLLDDDGEAIRLSALRALGASRDARVATLVAQRVLERRFAKLSINERRVHFLVLTLVAGDDSITHLRAILERRSWLRRIDEDTRTLAVHAVGTLASQEAHTLLVEERKRSRDDAAKALCERLAKEVARRFAESATVQIQAQHKLKTKLEETTRYSAAEVRAALATFGETPLANELAEVVDLSVSAKKRILVNHERIQTMSHYEVLDVEQGATADEIKAAYQFQIARFNRSRYYGKKLGSFGPKIEAIRVAVELAREVLTSTRQRKQYDAELRVARPPRSQ